MPEHVLTAATESFQGLAGAPGRAIGPVYHWDVPLDTTADAATDDAVARLHGAFTAARERLERALAGADATLAPLLDAQQLMLDDPEVRDGIFALAEGGTPAAEAISTIVGSLAEVLEGAGSDYFRERAIDVRAVGTLLLEGLTGPTARSIPRGAVVLARELAPLDTAQLAEAGVAAFVTVTGGPTCHAAIIARAWGIPAVVGAPESVLKLPAETPVLIDGADGRITPNPTPEMLERPATTEPALHLTRRVPVYANIGSLAEAEKAAAAGAEGVGLLRTEFLFQSRTEAPSEDEQTEKYTAILRALDGRPVVVRTLDIGADKPAPFLPMPAEPNPQLGLRGIRLCLQQRDLFRTQLRALLRAATAGPLRIMLPMVTMVEEVREARALLEAEAADLGAPVPPLGAMLEVPMAALAVPELAPACDFFSLGTNDLLQFLLAADRQHAGVGYLHAVEHPAVWRLLAQAVEAAHAAGRPLGVCGEWGADAHHLPRLLDLGIDTISVAVGALPRVRGWFGL